MRLIDFLFPPKCVCCDAVLESAPERVHKSGGDAFCPECRAEWEQAKLQQCAYCRLPMMDCRCSSNLMRRSGNNVLLKLCAYGGEYETAVKRLIFMLKRYPDRRAELFAANQLLFPLKRYASIYLGADLCITNIPRRYRGYAFYGYDHAEVLAKNIAKLSGIPYICLLDRIKDGKEQKGLGEHERLENVRGAFALTKEAGQIGKRCVILVDDIVTTGASMNECISVLKKAEPAAILPICIAHTTRVYDPDGDKVD